MRGASSKDGKLGGNRQLVEAYDKDKGHQEPKSAGGHSGGVHDEGGNDAIKQVVGEHGKARVHHITKKDAGGYSSETEHEDGFTHEHEHHETLADAHTHGASAMDDGDHVPFDDQQEGRANQRHMNERKRSGSGDGSFDFLPGEK